MNNAATLEKMRAMKLLGMARSFEESLKAGIRKNFTADELLAHLVDAEHDDRTNRMIARRIKQARLRQAAFIEEIDYSRSRNIDKNQILRLSEPGWISAAENIIITGATGTGKSYIACAIARAACMRGLKVRYVNCMKLFGTLKLAKSAGNYAAEITKLERQDLLVLDDFGLEVLDGVARLMLLELLEDRHGKHSSIVVSQLPIAKWHAVIGDATIADAVCDRMVHSSYIIDLEGDTMRRKTKK